MLGAAWIALPTHRRDLIARGAGEGEKVSENASTARGFSGLRVGDGTETI